MKKYFLTVTMLLALGGCQGDEPKSSAPRSMPATTQTAPASPTEVVSEQAATTLNESAAQAQDMANSQLASSLAAATAAAKAEQPAPEAKTAAKEKKVADVPQSVAVTAKELLPTLAKPALPAASPAAIVAFGDAEKGKVLARKCAACHSFETKNKMGPGLAGVVGREAGSVSGFKYQFTSFIQSGKAWHWDEAHLAAWICDAKKAVKAFTGDAGAKTKMGVQRICDTTKQADIIAYLKTL